MKTRKNRRLILTMSIVLALVAILAATFAWFTTHDSVTNHLESGSLTNGDAKIVEIFDKDEPLEPGTSVDKFVGVVNTGSTEAFVRISFAETIQKLADNGASTAVGTKFSGAANIIPQLFDKAAIEAGAYKSWTLLEEDDDNFDEDSLSDFLDATTDIEVLYNKITANNKAFYQFVAYAPLSGLTGTHAKYNGQLQLVDINIKVTADPAGDKLSIEQIDIGSTKVDIAYWQFTQAAQTTARWAALADHSQFSGYTNTLNTPPFTLDPDRASPSHVDSIMIKLVFGANVKTSLSACSKGDWWYNSNDGYFYYIGKLASGAQTTNWLLEAVNLDKTAGNAYCNLNYELTPCMDAIQAIGEAVSDAGGWNLSGDSNCDALITKLLTAS